ncbi:tubulin polyglutamylase TTLL13 isoform X5 [Ahaetulla prasina]|uniref:tubulin polyglutamylase TTLL13 isoform X5 n=1 Tax=Ahaetulla prasina TaxID=499056 RepID=UPI002649270A|nr:tubulin polyglutamylase TTLL13 isoform X5 [Ahaetulla prasina]
MVTASRPEGVSGGAGLGPERMKIGREESSESENESDEEDEEEEEEEEGGGGLSDESANECLKRPETERKEPPRASPPDKGPEPGWEQLGAGPEEPTAEEGEPEEPRPKRKRRHRLLSINLANCKYESVRRAARRCGLKEVGEDEEWTVYWTDCSVSLERVMEMKRFQKINHFPGMAEICRKDLLARNLNRMLRLFPKEYCIFPRTWCLPADYGDFQAYGRMRKNRTYICKPDSGCQGRGIFITRNPKEIKHGEHMICQQYITKPFLIDGFKFDMRIYVLVTSCDPLKIFVYEEGLARFATMRYIEPNSSNLDDICMHLTNYAINKHNENFVRDDNTGSKRKLSTLNTWMREHSYDTAELWQDIEDIIIKTLIAAHPVLKHNYRTCFPNHISGCACFEILGFDILLDRKLKPWLLEMASLQYDSMTPQAIVEEEEVERVKALLRRENLIRGLGIVDQLTRLLRSAEPKPVEVQRPHINVSECQPHFLQDVFNNHNTQDLMTLVPLSLLRGSAQELGRQILQQQPTARVQLLGNQGFIPTILGALSGLGPPREPQLHFQPPRNLSWLGPAMVGEPCTLARMLKAGGRRFASAKNKAEGNRVSSSKRPLYMSPGSLNCLSHPGNVAGTIYSSFPFPSVAAPLNRADLHGLAINSASAPLIRRGSPHRATTVAAMHSSQASHSPQNFHLCRAVFPLQLTASSENGSVHLGCTPPLLSLQARFPLQLPVSLPKPWDSS